MGWGDPHGRSSRELNAVADAERRARALNLENAVLAKKIEACEAELQNERELADALAERWRPHAPMYDPALTAYDRTRG